MKGRWVGGGGTSGVGACTTPTINSCFTHKGATKTAIMILFLFLFHFPKEHVWNTRNARSDGAAAENKRNGRPPERPPSHSPVGVCMLEHENTQGTHTTQLLCDVP